ncbi:low temperature requirement protein A [Actinoplanes sp. NPDC049265]|uniref:low temperature requirement protein A n=1 Tax=Actinoplanes sp. NPDC049265 TaxID=3363902 RepID=UPI00371969D5
MPSPAVEERHATWLELFFDLVIVVAVARLAELLHEAPAGTNPRRRRCCGRPPPTGRTWVSGSACS